MESTVFRPNKNLRFAQKFFGTLKRGSEQLQIINILSEKYKESSSDVTEKVRPFIKSLVDTFGINLDVSMNPVFKSIPEFIHKTKYPTTAAIELTHKCNLECKHCYGEYGKGAAAEMPFEKAIKLLKDLKKMGVRIIEYTGGEIGIYNKLADLLKETLNLGFDFVVLLSNGVKLSSEVRQILIDNKDRMYIQIDVHSFNEQYLKWFTGRNDILNKTMKNIETLAKKQVPIRIATIVTSKNINELEQIADWAYMIGAKKFVVSPVIKLGMAKKNSKELFIENESDNKKLSEALLNIQTKYPSFFSINEGSNSSRDNCGCLTSVIAIDPVGNIKLCSFDNGKYFNGLLGNVFEENAKDIYDKHSELIKEIFHLKQPKYNSSDCKLCEHRTFCSHCLLRALMMGKEKTNCCNWYRNNVSDSLRLFFEGQE